MAARRFWPATRLGWLNVALAALLLSAGVRYHDELRWAWGQVGDYRQGHIGSPLERKLYLAAQRRLYQGRRPDEAIALLRASIGIDPNTEAGFLLAESYRAAGALAPAAQAYERFLRTDYLHVRARLALIETRRRMGDPESARRAALAGARIFEEAVRRHGPVPDDTVDRRFNDKARQVYAGYVRALARFRALAQPQG